MPLLTQLTRRLNVSLIRLLAFFYHQENNLLFSGICLDST